MSLFDFLILTFDFPKGGACGPGYPLILREALATRLVSVSIPTAKFPVSKVSPTGGDLEGAIIIFIMNLNVFVINTWVFMGVFN